MKVSEDKLSVVVEKGETIWGISKKLGYDYKKVMRINGFTSESAKKMQIGTVLYMTEAAKKAAEDSTKKKAAAENEAKKETAKVHADPRTLVRYSLSRDGEKNISAHFKAKEFKCPGTDVILIKPILTAKLEELRSAGGDHPVHINSGGGYRTPEYNASLDGASSSSEHKNGGAADIRISGLSPLQVARLAQRVGFDGIILHKTYVHLDMKGRKYHADWRTKAHTRVSDFSNLA